VTLYAGIRNHRFRIGITGHGIWIRDLGIGIEIGSESEYFNLESENNFGIVGQNIQMLQHQGSTFGLKICDLDILMRIMSQA